MGAARSAAIARIALALAAVVTTAVIGGSGASAAGGINAKHFFWAPGQSPQGTVDAVANDIIYHGGSAGPGAIGIQKKPAVYLIYWGTEWASGFTTQDTDGRSYSSKTLQNYLNTFMAILGGSPWAAVQTQYCRNVPAGTTSCAGIPGADYVTNPKHQLKGVWTDPTPPTTSSRSGWRRTSSTIRSRWRPSAPRPTSPMTRTRRTSS